MISHDGCMTDQPDIVGDPAQILREGRIVSVNRGTSTCVVAIGDPDDEGGEVETGNIPWLCARAGETIVWSAPSEGEAVLLACPGGDIAQGIAIPGIYSTAFPAPGNGSREFIRYEDGAEMGYDPESGEADITLPSGGRLTIIADGGVTIQGDLKVEGEIEAEGDVTGSGVSLANHTHGGVQAGGAETQAPS
jgi:phage baseplate assembly protein V